MKMESFIRYKWIILTCLGLLMGWPGAARCVEYSTGQVTAAILLQDRINLTVSDKAIVNLGAKEGLIKGDILVITPGKEMGTTNPIAECAVLSLLDNGSSVCQIITARVEVQRGNFASMEKFRHIDEKFYPLFYNMLARTVDPYEPYKKINVYVHDIFDEGNNATALSRRLKRGLEAVFSQKARIRLHRDLGAGDFLFYPSSYRDTALTLSQTMIKAGVDVFITGTYRVKNDALYITLYRFDRNYGDEGMAYTSALASLADLAEAGEIILPFRPVQKKEYVSARLSVRARQYVPEKDEIGEVVAHEANGDVFKTNSLKRVGFNVVSPMDIVVKIDNQKLNFLGKDDIILPAVEKGVHRISASFKRGYYANNRNSLLFSSTREIQKEIMLSIDRDGDLFMEIHLNPSFDRENVDFRIYKQTEKTRLLLKPVQSVESGKPVEFFRD